MKLILLSGGSGKRLWPMSNDSRSKQFLKVLQREDGTQESMLERVWRQLAETSLQAHTYVCASKAQQDAIFSQIGQVPFIEEPERRDTFPAITLAATYLRDIVGCPENESVIVLPVDHFVDAKFFRSLVALESILQYPDTQLALMGVEPISPTSKFGYIATGSVLQGANLPLAYAVNQFVEKPEKPAAERLIAEGALWNCGVFCFRLGLLGEYLASSGYPTTYEHIREEFHALPARSFDYEFVEKQSHIAVVPYQGTWKDLGTWGTLSEEMTQTFLGRGMSKDCINTHVVNEIGIPLIAMGLNDTIVVATPDGILVSDKSATSALKDVTHPFHGRPMYEERRWGSYRVLDLQTLPDESEALTKCLVLLPGHNISYQRHQFRSEVWTVLQGSGQIALDRTIRRIHKGDVIQIHAGQWHALRAEDKLTIIEVQSGTQLVEEDIHRMFLHWPDIVRHCDSNGL